MQDPTIVVAVFQIAASVSLVVVSISVFLWTRRRDRLDLDKDLWKQAQEINMSLFADPAKAALLEEAIYGKVVFSDEDQFLIDAYLFLFINRILQVWLAHERGLMTYHEYIASTRGTLKLIIPQRDRIRYLLLERGYSGAFRHEFFQRLERNEVPRPRRLDELTTQELERKISSARSRYR